jgi:hypothetical protein
VWASLLRPQLLASTTAGALFLAAAVLATVAAVYARWRPGETQLIRGAAAAAAIAAAAALVLPKAPVPGLLLAFPLLPVGLVLMRRSAFESAAAQLALITGALFAAAIVATQYPVGGSMEWGGRFFHLALPAVVPALLLALVGAWHALDARTARVGAASLAVVSLVLCVFAVGSIVRIRDITADLVDNVVHLADATSDATDRRGPVVVSNMEAVGRLSWRGAVHGRYLRVTDATDLPAVSRRLAADGVDEFVFAAAFHQDRDRARLRDYAAVAGRTVAVGQWRLYLMRRDAA